MRRHVGLVVLATLGFVALLWAVLGSPPAVAETVAGSSAAADPSVVRWAYVSAAAATALSAMAAAYAVARLGSAAVGALVEKPELFGRLLVLVGLAEGIAIYGLIVSILILTQAG